MGPIVLLPYVCLLVVSAFSEPLELDENSKDVAFHEAHSRLARSTPKCMAELGCFPITPEFSDPFFRPINLNPADRAKINTTFLMYSVAHPKTPYVIKAKDKKMLKKSGFDVKKKTKMITHGFIDNQRLGEWMRELKDQFLLNGDHNVIIVDWSGGSRPPYARATANTRVVGAEIALLLNWLKDTQGLKLGDVHIIGHSLGAHAAGYAGHILKGQLGRITGMDPAGPNFQLLPANVRLDPTDAKFVDVIHSDTVAPGSKDVIPSFGLRQAVGHLDFYPNDGQDQPGCTLVRSLAKIVTVGIFEGARRVSSCNHQRSVDFALDSINKRTCVPTAFACPDWRTFLAGRCAHCGHKGNLCAEMGGTDHFVGKRNTTNNMKFFLKTADKPPYCLFQYQLTVKLSNGKNLKEQTGVLNLKLKGQKKKVGIVVKDGEYVTLKPGSVNTFLLTTPEHIGDLTGATFSWDSGRDLLIASILRGGRKNKAISVEYIRIVPMFGLDERIRKTQTRKYCGGGKATIKSKEEVAFNKSDLC